MTAAAGSARARTERIASPAFGVALLLGLWVVGGRAGWAKGMVVTPRAAIEPIVGDSAGVYLRATTATLWVAARGFVIGSVLAFAAALVATALPPARRTISKLAAIVNAAPWVAVAPCLMIVLGNDRAPVAIAVLAVFFFVFVSASVGLAAEPASARDATLALGASRWFRLRALQIPASWPSVVDGLKLAAPAALTGAIFGEWFGAERGLGVLLLTAMRSARPERLWAASLLACACGLLAYGMLAGARRLLVARYGGTIAEAAHITGNGAPARHRLLQLGVDVVASVALLGALVFLWWAWIRVGDVSPLIVPSPGSVLDDLLTSRGEYVSAAGHTLLTAAAGLLLGTVVGIVAAVVSARIPLVAGAITPLVIVLAAAPIVALFPLFARIFGYQPTTVRVLAAVMVFFPVFVFTRSGLASAGGSIIEVVEALGASERRAFRLVTAPAAVPHLAAGVRIAAGTSVIAAVVGETLIGREGLGVEFSYAYALFDMPRAFGAAVVIVATSVAVFAVAGAAERALNRRWT